MPGALQNAQTAMAKSSMIWWVYKDSNLGPAD
jgi:hypothetical protein